jgi:transcriptional regulator with XRE-family HTH domain
VFKAEHLKLLRQVLGMTQGEFARKLGISHIYQRKLENGLEAITGAYLHRLNKHFLYDDELRIAVQTIKTKREQFT